MIRTLADRIKKELTVFCVLYKMRKDILKLYDKAEMENSSIDFKIVYESREEYLR